MLDNTGGVKNLSTWETRVCVQELQGGKRLGFMFGEPGLPGVGDASYRVRRPSWTGNICRAARRQPRWVVEEGEFVEPFGLYSSAPDEETRRIIKYVENRFIFILF